jgi:predicted deacylase
MGIRRVWGLRNRVVGGITSIGFWFLGAAGTVLAQSDSSQQPFSIAGHVVSPGTTASLKLLDSNSFDAVELSMPLLVAHGVMPGPVLCLTGGIHGDEINGVEVARRAFAQTDATTLKGTLVVAPLINHEGFRSGSRYMPDRRDLNRYFPGPVTPPAAWPTTLPRTYSRR